MLQDPSFAQPGRRGAATAAGCRCPWSGDAPPFGFRPGRTAAPLAAAAGGWAELTVAAQTGDPDSTLEFYRTALAVRRGHPAFATDSFTWLPGPAGVLCFRRGTDVTVMINVSDGPADLPPHEEILAASYRPVGGVLLPDAAVWLRTEPPAA